jgi:hypothetical protein
VHRLAVVHSQDAVLNLNSQARGPIGYFAFHTMAATVPPRAYLKPHQQSDVSTSHLHDIPVLEKAFSDLPPRDDDLSIPDGGRGWVVLTGCTIVSWWSVGTAQSYGILQAALLEENVSTSVNLMFVGCLSVGLVCALALLYGKIMRTLGTRRTAMLGVLLMSLSGAISSVVYRNIGALFAAYGLLMGLGMGLTFTVCWKPLIRINIALLTLRLDRRCCSDAILPSQTWPSQRHRSRWWWCRRRSHQCCAQRYHPALGSRLGVPHPLSPRCLYRTACRVRNPGKSTLQVMWIRRLVCEK